MAKQVKRKLINFIILTVTLAVSCVTLPVMSVAAPADTRKHTYTESKALADYGLSQWSTEYYSNGLLKVKRNGKTGFIDKTGTEVIPCVYKDAGHFIGDGNYTVVYQEIENSTIGKAGIIDRKGSIILPVEYDNFLSLYGGEWSSTGIFNEYGYALARKEKYGIVDKKNKVIVPFEYWNISRFQNGLAYGVRGEDFYGECEIDIINEKGSVIRMIEANYIDEFNGELALINNQNKFGLINKDYEVVLPIEYDYISKPADGYYIVKKDNKLGAVDAITGEIVLPVEYDCAPGSDHNWEIEFSEGLIVFNKGGYWYENEGKAGAIDITGKTVIPFEYTALGAFKNGVAYAYKDNETLGFIDKANKTVIPFEYTSMGYVLDDGYIVYRGCKRVYIDKTGKEIFETEYELNKFDWENTDPDYFIVSTYKEVLDINGNVYGRDYKYGVIDKTGKIIIPFMDSSQQPINQIGEYFIYTTRYEYDPKAYYDRLYVIYNKKGEKIGESVEYPIYYGEHDIFLVKTDRYDNKTPAHIIDSNGKPLFSPKYDICTAYSSKYDVFVVGKKDKKGNIKYGVADKSGDILIPLEYELISFTGGAGSSNHYGITPPDVFHDDGYTMVQKDGKFGYIHISGEIVVPCEYDRFINYNEGLVIAQKGKHTDINKPSPVKWHILELISPSNSELRGVK